MRLLDEIVNDAGHVDVEQWRLAHDRREPVARCACGSPAVTEPGERPWREMFGVRWFAMRCLTCDSDAEVPGNRTLSTSGRRPSRQRAAEAAAQTRLRLGEH